MLAGLDLFIGVASLLGVAGLPFVSSRIGLPPLPVGLLLAVAGVAYLASGVGLWRLRPFGRTIQLTLCWIGLLAFPVGTLISIGILYCMSDAGIKVLFSQRSAADLNAEEASALARSARIPLTGVVALIVLLSPAAVINAAIYLPTLVGALERERQQRTISEIGALGIAVENFFLENDAYPDARTVDELLRQLASDQSRSIAREDGWHHPFRYLAWKTDPHAKGPTDYAIASAGKDGVWEHEDLRGYTEGVTGSFDCDLVYVNGLFVRYPEGIQR